MGARGVAAGLSISVALTTGLLFEAWSRKTNNQGRWAVYKFFFISLLLSLAVGAILVPVYHTLVQIIPPGGLIPDLGICLITGLVFLVVLGGLGRLFKISEIQTLFGKMYGKIVKKIR